MTASVRRLRRIASAAAPRSGRIRVRSLASMATSVPVPMAMPRSAWASAAASLTPSPTIATTRPSDCSRAIGGDLVGRQHVGDHVVVVDTDLGGHGQRRRPVVAGQQDRMQAEGTQRREAGGAARLDRVGQRRSGRRTRRRRRTVTTVRPLASLARLGRRQRLRRRRDRRAPPAPSTDSGGTDTGLDRQRRLRPRPRRVVRRHGD